MQKPSLEAYFAVIEYRVTPKQSSEKCIFIFGGWLTRPFYYAPFIKRLLARGFDCVLYLPKRKLVAIGTEYAHMLHAADCATKDAQKRIAALENDVRERQGDNKPQISLLGVSLGSIFGAELGKRIPEIRRIALLTPAGDFEKHVAAWQKQLYFGRIVASQPTTPLESGRLLNRIGTLNNLHLLKDKQVLLGFVAKDRVIHRAVSKELITDLQRHDIATTVLEVKGNHNSGLLRYLFRKDYVDFLTKS